MPPKPQITYFKACPPKTPLFTVWRTSDLAFALALACPAPAISTPEKSNCGPPPSPRLRAATPSLSHLNVTVPQLRIANAEGQESNWHHREKDRCCPYLHAAAPPVPRRCHTPVQNKQNGRKPKLHAGKQLTLAASGENSYSTRAPKRRENDGYRRRKTGVTGGAWPS